jgi:hypothetical protein
MTMLATPKAGTREHMLLWLAGKHPDERYVWESTSECACGRYAREAMGKPNWWWTSEAHYRLAGSTGQAFTQLNNLASHAPRTYGALYERALAAWRS